MMNQQRELERCPRRIPSAGSLPDSGLKRERDLGIQLGSSAASLAPCVPLNIRLGRNSDTYSLPIDSCSMAT